MPLLKTYENHHEVLRTWSQFKGSHVITFDHHADTQPAFYRHAFNSLKQSGMPEVEKHKTAGQNSAKIIQNFTNGSTSLEQCINLLKHDEHIDFSVRSGMIQTVYVISSSQLGDPHTNPRIFVKTDLTKHTNEPIIFYGHTCLPDCAKLPHDETCIPRYAENAISDLLLSHAKAYIKVLHPSFFDKYILDIDLDYFHTIKAFDTDKVSELRTLAENAEAVTIALERTCVEECRFEGDPITADIALEHLLSILS